MPPNFIKDPIAEERTQQLRIAAGQLRLMADGCAEIATMFSDAGGKCDACMATHYDWWEQKLLRDKLVSAQRMLNALSIKIEEKAHDPDLIGDHFTADVPAAR